MKYSSKVKPISYVRAETLALLRILALGNRQIDEGRVLPAAQAFRRARKRQAQR